MRARAAAVPQAWEPMPCAVPFRLNRARFVATKDAPMLLIKSPLLPALASLFFLASCQSTTQQGSDYLAGLGGAVPQAPPSLGVGEQVSYWDDDGSKGESHVVVDIRRQV